MEEEEGVQRGVQYEHGGGDAAPEEPKKSAPAPVRLRQC